MTGLTVATKNLPRAIAKEKDGIVLYWVEELQQAGLSLRGLERLLDCDHRTAANLLQGSEVSSTFEAETVTDGGVQVVKLISESDLAVVLTTVVGSRCKAETRKNAAVALAKLASAGFKLLVMMELAPEQLATQAVQHANTRLRELELENENLKLKSSLVTMHGKELALRLMGDRESIVEIKTVVTEVVEPATGRSVEIITAEQLKRLVKERTGQDLKSLKWFAEQVRKAGRDDLLVAVTRHNTNEYPVPEKLDEALSVVYRDRQKLIGE